MPLALNGNKATQACEDVFRGPGAGLGAGAGERSGDCTEAQRSKYYSRISGPLLDRIDIQVEVPAVKFRDIVSKTEGEGSDDIRLRVSLARERQLKRLAGRRLYANAQMGPKEIKAFCGISAEGEKILETAVTKLGFSARAYDRVLKVARTIADLAGEEAIGVGHIAEAIQYRMMDRYY